MIETIALLSILGAVFAEAERRKRPIDRQPVTLYRKGKYLGPGSFWAEDMSVAARYGRPRQRMHTVEVLQSARVLDLDSEDDMDGVLIDLGLPPAEAMERLEDNDWNEKCLGLLGEHWDWVRKPIADTGHVEWVKITEKMAEESRPMTDQEKSWLEVGANEPEISVEECEWRFVRRYPMRKLVPLMRSTLYPAVPKSQVALQPRPTEEQMLEAWREWLGVEREYLTEDRLGPDYYDRMWNWVCSDPSAVDPVQLIEDPEGKVVGIWDGWHRTALAIVHGQPWLPAYVGKIRADVQRRDR